MFGQSIDVLLRLIFPAHGLVVCMLLVLQQPETLARICHSPAGGLETGVNLQPLVENTGAVM